MKIYRCVIGCLLVFFIAIGVWYVVSSYNEQRSTEDGILIWEQNHESDRNQWEAANMRGAEQGDTDGYLYQG